MFRNHAHKQPSPSAGFTLLELMMTLAIAAILAAVAAPSFSDLIKNNRMSQRLNTLTSSLSLARSEAIKRGVATTVCKRHKNTAVTKCVGGERWHTGWLVFVDANGNGAVDAGDEIIKKVGRLPSNPAPYTDADKKLLRFNNGNHVTYRANARVTEAGTFTFCDGRGNSARRGVVVSPSGRARGANNNHPALGSDTGLEGC